MKINKTKMTIGILAVLLVFAVGYIVVERWNAAQQEEQIALFQQGAQYGYEQAVIQIFQQSANCQQVPLRLENQTISIVNVNCLK